MPSSRRTWSARTRCSRRPARSGSTESAARRTCASTTCPPTRCTARSVPTIRRSARRRPTRPNSPYAASKAASDHLVRAYHHTYGLPVTTSNCSNNYGPYQFPEKLIPLMLVNALDGKPLPVYGDGAERARLAVRRGPLPGAGAGRCCADGSGETYNIGGRSERANLDLVRLLCGLVDEAFARDPELARAVSPQSRRAGGTRPRSSPSCRIAPDTTGATRSTPARSSGSSGSVRRRASRRGSGRRWTGICANEAWWRGVMDGRYRAWTAPLRVRIVSAVKETARRVLPTGVVRGLSRVWRGVDVAVAEAATGVLRRLPLRVAALTRERWIATGRLDYPAAPIVLAIDSEAELARLWSCRKEPEPVAWIEQFIGPAT